MVMDRTKSKRQIQFLDQKGQSTVEYILLFAVVISLVGFVMKSQRFQELFGEDGKFAKTFRSEIEYSYRHARWGKVKNLGEVPNYNQKHDSWEKNGATRFFGPEQKYP